LEEILPKVEHSKEIREVKEKIELINEKLKVYTEKLTKNNEEIVDLNSKMTSFEFDSSKLEDLEKKLKEKKETETEIVSQIQSLSREHTLRKEELQEKARELMNKEKEIETLEKGKERAEKLEYVITLLSRMREDIRNIRNVVRRNFLEDFRQEFQRKFEEIRKYEEEYSVDIKEDYEPIAYDSNGEEVPISSLSGGEKTSVALAYRLALADIAAQISDIRPSEILILDEPTTGFDQEDVKALPEALRNIKTIPQIIIVTHEEELKNAADFKFEVTKEMGKSKIKEID
ncbi:MAG: AAA family ATPase, partial [Nanoarchaeota archaeon]|nr:AAA family ATPase [Nanoarchaeota archaeon]